MCVRVYLWVHVCVCVCVPAHASHSDETHPKFSRSHTRATEKKIFRKINPSLKLRNLQRCIKSDISTPCSFREISSFNFFGRLVKFKALLNPKCWVLACFIEVLEFYHLNNFFIKYIEYNKKQPLSRATEGVDRLEQSEYSDKKYAEVQ